MIHLQKKLHDRHGATLIMALLLVLVAVVVSFIVIQAASSASLVAGSTNIFTSSVGGNSGDSGDGTNNIAVTFLNTKDGYTYNGQPQGGDVVPVVTQNGTTIKDVTIKYSTNGGQTWSTTKPTLTNVNTLNVRVQVIQGGRVISTGNGYTLKVSPLTVTIKANDISNVKEGTDLSTLTYAATVTNKVEDGYTLVYKFTTEKVTDYEYKIVPSGSAAQGNYLVNYESGRLTIEKTVVHALTVDATGMNFTGSYTGAPQQKSNGTITVRLDGTPLDASAYTLTYSYTKKGESAYTGSEAPTVTNVSEIPDGGLVVTVTASHPAETGTLTATGTYTMTLGKVNPDAILPKTASAKYGTKLGSIQLNETKKTVAGTFSWVYGLNQSQDTILNANTYSIQRVFTPSDTDNYNTLTETVSVTIEQATPSLKTLTASAVNAGQLLNTSTLSWEGKDTGTAVATNPVTKNAVTGTLSWNNGASTTLSTTDNHTVTFTPSDTTNYTTVTQSVSVTVNNTDMKEAMDAYKTAMQSYSTEQTYTKFTSESYKTDDGTFVNYTSSNNVNYWCIRKSFGNGPGTQYDYRRIRTDVLRGYFISIPSLPSASNPNNRFMAAIEQVVASKFDNSPITKSVTYPTTNNTTVSVSIALNDEKDKVIATFKANGATEILTYQITPGESTTVMNPGKQDHYDENKNYTGKVDIDKSSWQKSTSKTNSSVLSTNTFQEAQWGQASKGYQVSAKITAVKYPYTLTLTAN